MKAITLAILMALSTVLMAKSGADLAAEIKLDAGAKAIRQWERIFDKRSKWKRYKIDKLSDEERETLKKYVLDHAADSDRPAAAGIY